MGIIVPLPTPRRRRTVTVHGTSDATILLFMGVRYVRDFEPAPAAERPQKSEGRSEAPLELA